MNQNKNTCGTSSASSSCTPNKCIRCTVFQCANHCDGEDFCRLSSVQIGTHEANPTQGECTDCQSFRVKG